jgi:8-oxo-dGTP diphosphatase
MNNPVHMHFGNQVRVRACGICLQADEILLVNHQGVVPGNFWAPPGGGIQFNETAQQCIMREFEEETGLQVTVKGFLFSCELIRNPLHAIELFFQVEIAGGSLKIGRDPEMGNHQIISGLNYFSQAEIKAMPEEELHGIFKIVQNPTKIVDLRGYFKL